ncbi:type II toxin-antitoxin system death-on-curing family toxin [Arcanobacterium hippocoleae]|uniref:Death-on-curing family protein n=1 Tax=Arcanobacterium hippocoleae TaxID=149017 RepID=A0ABU1T2Q6_9ACTO|nr:type II toxin-antitoxin system death-on-curing family toxin [Arcanobacterium hippocoleae]MDR6939669.1 death-on-curing family protein [Arcanobacterium hippocoleae]
MQNESSYKGRRSRAAQSFNLVFWRKCSTERFYAARRSHKCAISNFRRCGFISTLIEKAACLGYSLSANHPFVDGNKRIGAHAMLVFLSVNGVELSYRDEELVKLYLDIASGKESQQSLASWIEAHMIDKNFLQ